MEDQAEYKTTTKPKGGRPKKEDGRKNKMGFNATDQERDRIKGRAEQAGLKVADYLRDCALKAKPRKVLSEEQKQLYRDFTGAVNNLNQLTKLAHQEGLPMIAPRLLKTHQELTQLIQQIRDHKD